MGILDKLRPQPRWKHAEPSVRLEAIADVDDAGVLAELATTDPDARVRGRALEGVEDVDILAAVAASDADAGVRESAMDALVEIANNPAALEGNAVRATAGLTDDRKLSLVARESPHAAARADAVARVTDLRSLGAIARHAADEVTAHAAADRLSDDAALIDVALNSAHKEVALLAFERAIDPEQPDLALLDQIASRAQQKAVARRAKAVLQSIADADAARKAAEAERQKHQASLLASVERLLSEADWRVADAALARAREAWAGAGDAADPEFAARFDAASAAARAHIDGARDRETAAALAAEERARGIAARESLCARLERLDVRPESPDALADARAEWQSLSALPDGGPDGTLAERMLNERFERALALCVRRHEQREAATQAGETLKAIAEEAASLAGNTLDEAVSRWKTLKRRWNETEQTLTNLAMDPPADAADQLRSAEAAITQREADARAERQKVQEERVLKLQRLADRAERVAKADAITLREGDRLLRDVKVALDEHPGDPRPEGYDAVVARLRGLLEKVGPRVHELRELDDWRRFANAQAQEDLIAKAEGLAAALEAEATAGTPSDLGKAAATLRDLQAKWKAAAEAPRDRAQELWHRFRTPVDAVRARCAEYYAQQASERAENIRKKTELCERAEALSDSTDWVKTADAFRALQAEWQTAGPVPPREARVLWERFRKASDAFFSRRRDDLSERKTVWAENLTKKEALCERAEALAESTEWESAASELKRLQAEWKTIGPVRKNRSDAIWKRFRAAADRFFERYHHRHEAALQQKAADREALIVELEALAASETQPETLAAEVHDLRAKLRVPAPVPRAEADAQAARIAAALATAVEKWPAAFQGTDLDPEAALKRMEKLCVKAEAIAESAEASEEGAPRQLSQAEALAAKLRQALAANSLGGRAEEPRGPSLADQVKELQQSWQRLVVPQGEPARALETRFHAALAAAKDKTRGQKREMSRA